MSTKSKHTKRRHARGAAYFIFLAVCALSILALWPRGGDDAQRLADLPDPSPIATQTSPVASPTVPIPTPSPEPTQSPVPTPTPAPTPISITISAAGDCTFGGDPRGTTKKRFDDAFKAQNSDYGYFFRNLIPLFEADDLTFVNLEGPLTTATSGKDKQFIFRGSPDYAKILSVGGVEVCTLANNHSSDFYQKGLDDTRAALDQENVKHVGYEETYIATVKGVKVGFCGYAIWSAEPSKVRASIEALRSECEIVVAAFHWGEELARAPDSNMVKCAKLAIDAGADLVVGHHQHVVSGIEQYKGKTIVYGLGNFCFGGTRNPTDKDAIVYQQTFLVENGAVSDGGFKIIPISTSSESSTNNYQPMILEASDADRVLEKIEKGSAKLENPVKVRD